VITGFHICSVPAIATITSSPSSVSTVFESAGRSGILGKEIVDQFNHHAMKAGSFVVIARF
jgi:hypothetical protein